jgi:hypothetical protein
LSLNVVEVKNRNLLRKFIKFPDYLYKDDPNYVPHIYLERLIAFNKKLNPFYKHAKVKNFLAFQDNEVVGRISGIVNYAHNKFHEDSVGFFGNFDAIDEKNVSKILFQNVEDFLRKENLNIIRGPVNFSTNEECGLLIKGFDSPPKIMMTYNYQYYSRLIEDYGFRKSKDLYAYLLDREKFNMDKLTKASNLLKKRYNIKVRKIDFKNFNRELKIIYNIYNSAWEKNWGFVPMDEEEFFHASGILKYVADEDFILIAEIDEKPVGFIIGLLDINVLIREIKGKLLPFGIFKFLKNKKNIKTLRIITLGIVEQCRNKGLDYVLITEVTNNAFKKGVRYGECSWILEDNKKMNNALLKLSGEVYKIYRIYDKEIL